MSIIYVDLEYPRLEGKHDTIEIHLTDVRAADGIRVQYDFERDGWVIFQCKTTHPWQETDKYGCSTYGYEEEWIEKAFLPAWPFGSGRYFIEKDGTERYEED